MNTLDFNDKRYDVIRIMRIEFFTDEAQALLFKSYCNAETILKRDGRYYFCNEIPDAIIIEPIRPPTPTATPRLS